jgi:hypothetical protein
MNRKEANNAVYGRKRMEEKRLNFPNIGVIGLGIIAAGGPAFAAESLCTPTEHVFFNCRVKGGPKLLSVCGRAGEEATRGAAAPGDYLQYRFGPSGKPELEYPMSRESSLGRFQVASEYVPSAFYESYQLSFESGGTEYRVYAITEQADERGDSQPDKYGGVIVSLASGKDIVIPCGAPPQSDLGRLVRKSGVEHREGQVRSDGVTRARFQLCKAMPLNSVDVDFKPEATEYELRPLNDAFALGLHDTPATIQLRSGAAERLVANPRHGKLVRHRKTGSQAAWGYVPAAGFVGNDEAEFVVQGKTEEGQAVEFQLRY